MRKITCIKVGDVSASLYLDKIGYTYKITAKIGAGRPQVVAQSIVWLNSKEDAYNRMRADLYHITKQLELFKKGE